MSGNLLVMVEVPMGSRNRYVWDEELQAIRLDRFLFASVVYPADYGFVPDTLAEDGGTLDAIVCVTKPTFSGCVIAVKTIGLFRVRAEGCVNDKVVCIPAEDPEWNTMAELDDLPRQLRDEIAHFFAIYPEPDGRQVTVDGWHPQQAAVKVLAEAQDRYAKAGDSAGNARPE